MSKSRVEIIGGAEFSPHEWLRREVLWASLMTPYGSQLNGWLSEDNTQFSQHMGNVSRQEIYSAEDDSLSFFATGKTIGGLISSKALFLSMMSGWRTSVNILEVQARSVSRVLNNNVSNKDVLNRERAFLKCADLAINASEMEDWSFVRGEKLLRASQLMGDLAAQEASSWIKLSQQNEEGDLPLLKINNGGHPRSAGPRVGKLLPIFEEIVESVEYRQFASVK